MYNVPDWLERRAALTPNKVAVVDTMNGDRPITYRQWNQQVNRTAHFLHDQIGVRKGDRLAILAKNCMEYLDIWFALAKIGAILQNLNWRLTVTELSGLIEETAPVAVVYDPAFTETIHALSSIAGGAPKRFLHKRVSLGAPEDKGDIAFASRQESSDRPYPVPDLSPEDPWVICYTGGTTGPPKGAVLSYGAITANAINTIISWGLSPEDTTILNAPLFHTGGLNVFTAPLVYLGGTSVVCQEFDVEQTFDLLEGGAVTIWFGVPTMFLMMQNHPRWESADFSRLKILISGGAPCPLPVFERFWAKGVDFKTGYGLTEAGPNTFWLPAEQVRAKPGAVGYPLFHVEVRVIDGQGQACGPDEPGELIIRGPHLFSGYWNNPQATAQALREEPGVDERGLWLHTGDLASYDQDGCYSIVGRLKDMFISGGENIYPSEIESALHAHPAIAEAALIGVPDDKWGEVGWAIVVPREGMQIDQEQLLDFLQERLARYKIPKRVFLAENLPKTGANKVDKKLLIQKYLPEN